MTKDQLAKIALNAPSGSVDELWPFIENTLTKYELDTSLRQSHFVAQILHESGEFRYREEIASGRAYEGREDLGNTKKGDGRRFKGRGLIQLTGRTNYMLYGRAIGRETEVLGNPEIIASDNNLCVDTAGYYWDNAGLSLWADKDDLLTITRRINGGLTGLSMRRKLLNLAKKVLGETT